ncbi:MAG: hypothetical protein A3J10_00580 [Candidatus Sungbacteria bacterium RIFCSPLOWO2_02_FULL_54_10]|nr:MAG: hypothetical protein A2679_01300 [Candidatus Sungbacteria bacterium RIFCSPHIGHO2_01_FULL_54_26]OHA12999.1 MAG: hypothetical protein A3J10_00580 [Candidatus Sungbacteria bacterium RIFCSPLOWO2_02_FULL_54_10]
MNTISIEFGDVKKKKIVTPNDFVSHMIEHVAWRMGLSIDLVWEDENWRDLGKTLGEKIRSFKPLQETSATVGMIDDGSAEVSIDTRETYCRIDSSKAFDLDWFLKLRCEQLTDGSPLVVLLEGLSDGLGVGINITIGNLEDQHHTWEGVYRAVGIALSKIYTPQENILQLRKELRANTAEFEKNTAKGEIQVLERSVNLATVRRGTAETGVTVTVDLTEQSPNNWKIDVADSIREATQNIPELFENLTKEAGLTLNVEFKATVLSSSHVVFEDVGMVTGRALLEILKLRMEKYGVNGAGSNVQTPEDLAQNGVNVALSIEGRKFWRYVPFDGDAQRLRKTFLIGQNILGSLRSEDVDDFIDGLSGGMSASVMVHLKEYDDAGRAWQEVFTGLGKALKEVFDVNPFRKGVPPGVKATLA